MRSQRSCSAVKLLIASHASKRTPSSVGPAPRRGAACTVRALLVERDPVARGGVDLVVDVEGQEAARLRRRRRRPLHDDEPAEQLLVVVAVEVGDADEVEHREAGLLDVVGLARAAAAHLLVEDRAPGEAGHDQIDDLGAVEAGVEHVHADQDLREAPPS